MHVYKHVAALHVSLSEGITHACVRGVGGPVTHKTAARLFGAVRLACPPLLDSMDPLRKVHSLDR